MGDRVRFAGDGCFELLGRGDHLAKIEDKRVSLAEIERYLLETPWIKDAACVALEDGAPPIRRRRPATQRRRCGRARSASAGGRSMNALKAVLRPRIEALRCRANSVTSTLFPSTRKASGSRAMLERAVR